MMTILQNTLLSFCILFFFACKPDPEPIPEPTISNEAELLRLDIDSGESVFATDIDGTEIELSRNLPFGTETVSIKFIQLSPKATANIHIHDVLVISDGPVSITVTAEDGTTTATYMLNLAVDEFPSVVKKHGLLRVQGNKIVDQNEEVVSLAGNSFFWSNNNWGGERYYTPEAVSWLKKDWNTSIVRAAMGVEDDGGYLSFKLSNKDRVKIIVDAAIAEGLYVIIDWHSHHAEDNPGEAVSFFQEMATLYGAYDNIIYEIYNEPLNVSWDATIKPYAEAVIGAIRAIDSDNLIVVGTPEWSQRVDLAAANPISKYENIAYTLHFYTVHHQQALRDRATAALNSGIALFVTEWGSIGYTQTDPETDAWMDWCRQHNISHCNWAVNDKQEEWSILVAGASTVGGWADNQLTDAGKLARSIIRSWSE
ncbi:MAG: glycoside hydrolase family 5 protein [Bacteroidota bacterium]